VNIFSRATVQSAIVLMNRRMKVERGVITFDPVCSSVEDMHLHHLGGTNQAQAQTCRVSAQYDSTANRWNAFPSARVVCRSERRFPGHASIRATLPEDAQIPQPVLAKRITSASDLLRLRRWTWRSSLYRRRWSWRTSLRRRKYCLARHLRFVQLTLPLAL
jgi:hypothetical protein